MLLLHAREPGSTQGWPPAATNMITKRRFFFATRLFFHGNCLFRTLLILPDKHFDFTPYFPVLTSDPWVLGLPVDLEVNIPVCLP